MCSRRTDETLLAVVTRRALPVLVATLIVATAVPVLLGRAELAAALGPGHATEVYRMSFWISVWTGVAVGLALVAGFLSYWFIARKMTAPLTDLAAAADGLTRTHGSTRFDTESPIREIHQLTESFNKLFATQDGRLRELSELTRGILHDLRTPISHIRNAADELMHTAPDAVETAETIIVSCDSLIGMIDANTEISRHYNRSDISPASTLDFTAIVRDGVQLFSAIADEKGIRLSVALPDRPLLLSAHKAKLQSLIGNLLDNALKFTPAGGTVSVSAEAENGHLTVRVADTGCGIGEKDLPHVFDRFYRADYSRQKPGLGLGLALVHSIVTFYGGDISCDSAPGRGAAFTIHLPLARPAT